MRKVAELMVGHALLASLVASIAVGAALRLYRLDTIPGGLHFDEAANLFDILDLERGARPVFFPANSGREPLFIYAQFAASQWFGPTPYALRLVGALFGILALPAMAFAASRLLATAAGPIAARRGAVLAVALLVGTYAHLHFSRFGLRTISFPPFELLVVGFLWLGLQRRRAWPFLIAGAVAGGALYTYLAARLLPVVIALFALYLLATRRWADVGRMLLMAPAALLVAAPLLRYFVDHPNDLVFRADGISLLNPANRPGNLVDALVDSASKTLLMFVWQGSHAPFENLPGRPWFDPIVGAAFIAGVVLLLAAMARPVTGRLLAGGVMAEAQGVERTAKGEFGLRDAAVFLFIWLGIMLVPALVTVHAPAHLRVVGAIPPAVLIAALGLLAFVAAFEGALARRQVSQAARPVLAGSVAALLIAASTLLTVRDYFLVWAPSDEAFGGMMTFKVVAAEHLNRWAAEGPVYLAPLYAEDHTIRFLTRDAPPATFDMQRSVVVPTRSGLTSGAVRYVFPSFDHEQPRLVRELLPVTPTAEGVGDATGRHPILSVLRLDAALLPEAPTRHLARFGDQMDLVQLSLETPEPVPPGRPLSLVATWYALRATTQDLTIFFHLRDQEHRTIAQYDGQPSGGRYPTYRWRAGEPVFERYALVVPPGTAAGDYRLIVGLYDPTMRRQPVRKPDGADGGTEHEVRQVRIGS